MLDLKLCLVSADFGRGYGVPPSDHIGTMGGARAKLRLRRPTGT